MINCSSLRRTSYRRHITLSALLSFVLLAQASVAGGKGDKAISYAGNSGTVDSAAGGQHMKAPEMQEVVVTGQYTARPADKTVQRVRLIGREKIETMGAQNLRDVMMNEMNIGLSQDNILGSSLSLQGISGQNVKILVDGVPVIGRQDGDIDISQIMLHNAERIEIIEGPMSVTYGTDALAGTINIITRKSISHNVEAGATSYTESVGNYNLNGRINVRQRNQTIIVSGARNLFNGWRQGVSEKLFDFSALPADSSRASQWKPKIQYNGNLQYTYKLNNTTLSYKGDYFRETIINRGTPDYFGENAVDDYYHTTRIGNAVFANSTIARYYNLNAQVSYNDFKRVKNAYAKDLTTLSESLSEGTGSQDTSKFGALSSRATLSTAKPEKKLNYEVGYDINIETGTGVRIKNKKQQIGDYAVFVSAEYKPVKNLILRPGLRYAYNTAYGSPLIPSVNVLYSYHAFTLRSSYARGFRAPSLKELYFDFHDVNHDIDGNENLKPEYSDNYSASLAYNKKIEDVTVKVEVNSFYNDIRNRIDLAAGSGTFYSYVNVGKFKTKGVQLCADASYKGIKASVGAGYVGRMNTLAGEGDDLPTFFYTPELRGSVMYDIEKIGVTVGAFIKCTGNTPGVAINSTTNTVVQSATDGFTMADASVSKHIWHRAIQLTLGSKNVFNVTSVASKLAGSATPAFASPYSLGRTYFVKLDLNFNSK
ncbi:MAG: TonB-dependent receptor [Sphingobacteriales bacterium]|nr:MAG: TonB-dependent receptor [Sphingobacteriales bacterium]